VFGIEPRSIAGVPLAHLSIEEMAAFYVEEIRREQPAGPFFLGGMCAGGVIAYEMASQLVRAGERLELVAMLDAALPNIAERPGRINQQRLDRLKQALAREADQGPLRRAGTIVRAISQKVMGLVRWQISRFGKQLSVRARFRLLRSILTRDLAWPKFVPELSLREIYDCAVATYEPKPLSISSVMLVRAQTGEGEDTPYREIYIDQTLGWGAVVQDLVTVDVAGGHTSMLQEHFVDSLAGVLMPYLKHEEAPVTERTAEFA